MTKAASYSINGQLSKTKLLDQVASGILIPLKYVLWQSLFPNSHKSKTLRGRSGLPPSELLVPSEEYCL